MKEGERERERERGREGGREVRKKELINKSIGRPLQKIL